MISDPTKWDAHDGIKKHKAQTVEQTENGIVDCEFSSDRWNQQAKNHTIDKRKNIREGHHAKHSPGSGGRWPFFNYGVCQRLS